MKKVIALFLGLVVLAAVWYFFIKPNDFIVRFEAPSTVGTINQSIKSWKLTKNASATEISNSLSEVRHSLVYGDSTHQYTWKLKALTDSTTAVTLGVKDQGNTLANKVSVLLGTPFIRRQAEANAKDFYKGLIDHLDNFDVTIDGESVTPPSYAAYVTITGTQLQKAGGMMKYYGYLSQIMLKDGIEPKGTPFIEVTNWDKTTDSITYNFCFPIKNRENLPTFKEVQYKRFLERKALKATYHGNYITSDRAWYRLLSYAKDNNIEVVEEPFEIFYNNPSSGGNERNWKAEVFMPIKE